jgi:hypothetical protein
MLIIRFGYTLKNKAAGGKKQHGIMKGKKTLVFSRSSTLLWPPTIGKRLTSPQGAQQQQQSHVGTLIQIQQDKELVNRLFPYIIQKIDGKTLAQKIDGGLLAQKIFPYLDLISTVNIRYGPYQEVVSSARCLPGEKLVGGGY